MSDDLNGTEIAIIGIAGRFPGARDIEEFWRNLRDGVESVTIFTDDELKSLGVDAGTLKDPNYVKAAALLDDIDLFDASFFGINHREAEIMDPQHRILLECAWEALEHAGYDSQTYKGAIGVFAGATINTYLLFNVASNPAIARSVDDLQINIGNGGDFLTTRLSYKMNLKGPSHLVQSACSTSLLAVHVACQSLLNEESDIALAGGVSISVNNRTGYHYMPGGMTSPDGHCRAFDARAQGTIFGSGAGVVVLKRLTDALADGDGIHGVIKGSAINNDGSLKVGYTAPSVDGQAEVITEALANAGVDADTISYVEAHGTGTPLGDPIEIQALTKAFRAGTNRNQMCAVGSVKTNIGHLDAAAGIAGLIKTVLALKHKMLPPSLNFEDPNPNIDFQNSPFRVNARLSEWETDQTPRRAGVSAFGVGGTNAHVVLEESPAARESSESRSRQLLVLSAKTSTTLERLTTNLAQYLKQQPNVKLADVAYTLQVGRRNFNHRRMLVCRNTEDAINGLEGLDRQRLLTAFEEGADRPVIFMFPGQGSQSVNMALGLYKDEPFFRKQIERCLELSTQQPGLDLPGTLYPDEAQIEAAARRINQTSVTQPVLFAIEYSLAQLWMHWGILPQAMIGHSIGEYVAACIADVFRLEEAIRLVSARGRLIQALSAGAMLAVPMPEAELREILSNSLSIAAINGPMQCVVSGPPDAVAELEKHLLQTGLSCRRLSTSHAFHSEMMEPALQEFTEHVERVSLKPPKIPFISNVTGTWMTGEDATSPRYWAKQLRQTVRFADGVQELLKMPERLFLEVGPGRTLARLVRRHPGCTSKRVLLASFDDTNNDQSDLASLLTTAGKLWMAGVNVNWPRLYDKEKRQRVALPTYAFERQRYWIDPAQESSPTGGRRFNEGKKANLDDWFYIPSWKRSLPLKPLSPGQLHHNQTSWLIFLDHSCIGSVLSERLLKLGHRVFTVSAGEFNHLSGSHFTMNPELKEDYCRLITHICDEQHTPLNVVHLWSVEDVQDGASEVERFKQERQNGFYSLLFFAQAIAEHSINEGIRIKVISNNLCGVTYEEVVSPGKATMLGPCKVIPQEFSNITCQYIDIVPTLDGTGQARLADQLLAEVSGESNDLIVAHRGNQRWIQAFEPVPLRRCSGAPKALRERGTYLITGGLAGIGFALSQHLAGITQARLVLLESRDFPQRCDWQQWAATHDGDDTIGHRILKARLLEETGTEVLIINVEISNEEQLKRAIGYAFERFGNLHGVIYAAAAEGKRSFKTIQETNAAESEWQFQPRVYGLLALEKALQNLELDFCIIVSSLSSVLGGIGSVIHTAASLFADAFVENHNKRSQQSWTCMNWDTWQFQEEKEQITAISKDLAHLAMTPEEGIEAFDRILSGGIVDQVILSTTDLSARIDHWRKARRSAQASTEDTSLPLHPRPQLRSSYVAPSSELERAITNVWQRAFGVEQIGVHDNFFDLGGDSLIAVRVISQLNKELSTDISVVSLYEGLTISSLVELLSPANRDKPSPRFEVDILEEKALQRKRYQEKQRLRRRETVA